MRTRYQAPFGCACILIPRLYISEIGISVRKYDIHCARNCLTAIVLLRPEGFARIAMRGDCWISDDWHTKHCDIHEACSFWT